LAASICALVILHVIDVDSYLRALSVSGNGSSMGLGGIWILGIWIWIFIVAIPSIVGIVRLLRHKHSGVYFSFAALCLIAISLPLAFLVVYKDNENQWTQYLLFLISLASTIAMFPMLLVGSKRTFWDSDLSK
jgi:hypothetical protein